MKTSSELFKKHSMDLTQHQSQYPRSFAVMNKLEFTDALKEHDAEIVKMIDDMINDAEPYLETGRREHAEIQMGVLTELKNKI